MKKAIYYDTATGAVIRTATMLPADEPIPPGAGESVTVSDNASVDMALHYVDTVTGDVIPRIPMPLVFTPSNKQVVADGVAELVVTGIPVGALIYAQLPEGNILQQILDGQVEISSDTPGPGLLFFANNMHLSQYYIPVEFI